VCAARALRAAAEREERWRAHSQGTRMKAKHTDRGCYLVIHSFTFRQKATRDIWFYYV
jgi:hypothetical protein